MIWGWKGEIFDILIYVGMHVGILSHTPPEWAYNQKSCPEKWYTTYCQGPTGVPKVGFDQKYFWVLLGVPDNMYSIPLLCSVIL